VVVLFSFSPQLELGVAAGAGKASAFAGEVLDMGASAGWGVLGLVANSWSCSLMPPELRI
jgi:hypothetical protein